MDANAVQVVSYVCVAFAFGHLKFEQTANFLQTYNGATAWSAIVFLNQTYHILGS